MEKKDWLLLAIGELINPLQLLSIMFKVAKESGIPESESYDFVPCGWGPGSFGIYEDLASLHEDGLMELVPSGRGWNMYRLTERGRAKAETLESGISKLFLQRLRTIRAWVISHDFGTLPRDMRKEYPEYTTGGASP